MKNLFIFASLAISIVTTSRGWADDIYSCNGVIQNKPCELGQKGAVMNLPKIGKYEAESPRAALNTGELSNPNVNRFDKPVAVPQNISGEDEIMGLHMDVTRMNDEFNRLLKEKGTSYLQNAITRNLGRAQARCTYVQEDNQSKDLCRDTLAQLQRMQAKLPPR